MRRNRSLIDIIEDHERDIKRLRQALTRPAGGGGGGVTDHGALTGLADDDHGHYWNDSRGDAKISTHTAIASAHHVKYTDGEVDAIVLTHKNLASAHHSKYTDGEVDAIVLTHKNLASAHHAKYTDGNALTAMGVLANFNTYNHNRYLDSEAVTAVGTPWVALIAAEDHHTKYTDGEAVSAVGTPWVGLIAAEDHHTKYTDGEVDTRIGLATITDLAETTITAIGSGELLKWSGSAWINNTLAEAGIAAAGDLHAEAHTVASHSDTTATGAELETLTDGSNADSLHGHAGSGAPDMDSITDVTMSAPATGEVLYKSAGDWINRTLNEAGILGLAGDTMTGALLLPAGTASLPAVSFGGAPDKGMFDGGTDILSWSNDGTEHLRIDAGGSLRVGGVLTDGMAIIRNSAGNVATPTYGFVGDFDTGMYRITADEIGFAVAAALAVRITAGHTTGPQTTGGWRLKNDAIGSVSAPAYAFYGDTDTGMYRVGANVVGIATDGILGFSVDNEWPTPETSGGRSFVKIASTGKVASGTVIVTLNIPRHATRNSRWSVHVSGRAGFASIAADVKCLVGTLTNMSIVAQDSTDTVYAVAAKFTTVTRIFDVRVNSGSGNATMQLKTSSSTNVYFRSSSHVDFLYLE